MQNRVTKVIAVLLTTTILYANSALVVSYAADNFLSAKALESQGTSTTNDNVEFDVYYDGGKHTVSADVNAEDTKLNIALNVKKAGYLKDAVVDFSDANFKVVKNEESDNIQSIDTESKKISFNQINNGENITDQINIALDKKDEISEDMFDRDNTIKFTGTYVNAKGEEVAVKKDIIVHTTWTAADAKAKLEYEITKYIPYSVNNVSKLITQGKIKSYVENSVLPIKNTNIEVVAPKINNKYPETVTVVAYSTNATNGDQNGSNFSKDNWTYDSTTGKITITVNNNAVNGKIKWAKNTADEFVVTYIYSADVYQAVKDSVTRVTYDVKSSMNLYVQSGVNKVSANTSGYEDQTKKIGDIAEFLLGTVANMNKGYMYNNQNTTDQNRKETEYTEIYVTRIAYADVIDSIELKQDIDQFVTESGSEQSTTVGGKNYAYNKTLTISKQEFDKLFGTNGKITIENADGTTIATIDKNTEVKNNEIAIDLAEKDTNNITIKTSKPQTEGNLTIRIVKAIAKEVVYNVNQLKTFKQLKSQVTGTAKNGETSIVSTDSSRSIELQEPTQKASITTSNNRLSTIVKNENVEVKVTLENDSADDTMYSNPTVKVTFPANIETLAIKDYKVYFDDELSIDESSIKSSENEDGTKTIEFKLKGVQTKYNNVAAKGATITLITDITLNKLTPTTNTKITAEITNEDSTVTNVETEIKYVAPSGVVTTNAMTGYKEDESIVAINGEAQKALIPTKAEQKEVTYTMNVINNYENTLDHVVVLGRTPFKDNKDVSTSLSLGSNMTMPLASGITVTGIDSSKFTVYYSENGEATTDLNNTQNAWKTSVTDYTRIKSYMIVLNADYIMDAGSSITFTYKATLPANLDYDQTAYENYGVYFNNNKTSGTIADKAIATKIGLTTGKIAKLDAKLTSVTGEGATVSIGDSLEYELTINNTGAIDAENVVISMEMPNELSSDEGEMELDDTFAKQTAKISIGTVKANSTITKIIKLQVVFNCDKEVSVKAIINYGENKSIETNAITNKIITKYFYATMTSNTVNPKEGTDYTITVSASAMSITPRTEENKSRKNTIIKLVLPDELEYKSINIIEYSPEEKIKEKDITDSAKVNVNGNELTIELENLDDPNSVTIKINTLVKKLSDGVYKKDITVEGSIKADGIQTENFEKLTATVNKAGATFIQSSNLPEGTTISSGENFTYTFTIKNESAIYLNNLKFTDILPKEVTFKSLEVVYSDGTTDRRSSYDSDGNLITSIFLNADDTVVINVEVCAKAIKEDTKISNIANIKEEGNLSEIQSNAVSHVIKHYDSSDNIIIPDETEETRKIVGTVWIDQNKDGVKDATEKKVTGIKIILLDNNTGDIAINADNEQCITETGNDGAYMFDRIKQGKYTVVFLYDSSNYSATFYKKDGVSEAQNSDALDQKINYERKERIAGVSEEIVVASVNQYNIDLGIIENSKFDLKLDKIVETITVNNGKNTSEHVYNGKLAKIDFEAKYANSSSMVVKYKFTITNEGGIAGYVKKLADYLPTELKFNSELNKDWYEGKDGVIYNASLANTIINPGESKELTLVLTKTMNSEDYGLINNSAEIYETSNDYGLIDIDSTPGNKATSEDDYSTANVLTSVKTGQVFIYSTLVLTVIGIIGIGIYIIKSKILK